MRVVSTSGFLKSSRIIFFTTFLALLLLAMSFFSAFTFLNHKLSNQGAVTKSFSSKFVTMSPEEKKKTFGEFNSNKLFFSTIEAASNEVGFSIKEPAHFKLKGKLKGVFVTSDEKKEEREVYLIYNELSNPLTVLERKASPFLDYEALYKEMLEWKEKGYAKNDANPQLIKIRGLKALAIQPGYNLINGEKFPRPGLVDFVKGGVQYVVVGQTGEELTSLNELIEIAESL